MSVVLSTAVAAALFSLPADVAAEANSACSAPDHLATIVRTVEPNYPNAEALHGVSGLSVIRIDLSDVGRVVDAKVMKSSGSYILDTEAIRTVKAMSYAPQLQNCAAVPGTYAVEVEFPK
jgi:TonB family protein